MFIQNGLEIENFMDKIVSSFSKLNVVNSSDSLENIIKEDDRNKWTYMDKHRQ